MNQDSSTAWHQTLHVDPMLVAGDDDFQNFLQLGIDFPGFEEAHAGHNGFDTPMGDLGMDQLAMHSSVEDIRAHAMQAGASLSERGAGELLHRYSKISAGPDTALNSSVAHHHQNQQQQRKRDAQKMSYESRVMVPPTPQSSEMQGAAVRYYHYMDADGMPEFDPYQRHRDDQVGAKAFQNAIFADQVDNLHAAGFSSCHANRSKSAIHRVWDAWRVFQSFDFTCHRGAKPAFAPPNSSAYHRAHQCLTFITHRADSWNVYFTYSCADCK